MCCSHWAGEEVTEAQRQGTTPPLGKGHYRESTLQRVQTPSQALIEVLAYHPRQNVPPDAPWELPGDRGEH